MEVINHTNNLLRIHHIPFVPRRQWLAGIFLGTAAIEVLLIASSTNRPSLVLPGGVLLFFALTLFLPDERHIMWTFDKREGLLTIRRDLRTRQEKRQFPLEDIREAVLHTRPSVRRERGDTVRTEVSLKLRSGETFALTMTEDNVGWQEKQALVDCINSWLLAYRRPADGWWAKAAPLQCDERLMPFGVDIVRHETVRR